jgi:hypothetical protein
LRRLQQSKTCRHHHTKRADDFHIRSLRLHASHSKHVELAPRVTGKTVSARVFDGNVNGRRRVGHGGGAPAG